MSRIAAALTLLCLITVFAWAQEPQKTKAELEQELANTKAALAQLDAQSARSGATSPADCETVLHSLLAALAKASADAKREADGLGQQVRATSEVVTQGTTEIRQAQNESLSVEQAAASKAASDTRNGQLTQILGFLTVLGTIAARAYAEHQHHTETKGRLDALGNVYQRRSTDRPPADPALPPPPPAERNS